MFSKKIVIAVVLAMIAVAPIVYVVWMNQINAPVIPVTTPSWLGGSGGSVIEFSEPKKAMEPGSEFGIQKCKVTDGFVFSLILENGQVIEAMLPVTTKVEAMPVVIELLTKASKPSPSATLLRKLNDKWVVDIQLTNGEKRVKLRDVLKDKDLLL